MSIGGVVYNMTLTESGHTQFWVRDRDERTCVVGDDTNLRPRVSLGETIWWQSGNVYVHRDGKDIPFPKVSYSFDAGPIFSEVQA